MVSSGIGAVFSAVIVYPRLIFGAHILNTESDSLIRREPTAVQLSSAGQIKQKHKHEQGSAAKDDNFCDFDFPLGEAGKSKCLKSEHHLIEKPLMCIEAAKEAGAKADHDKFVIEEGTNDRWEHKRPKGCFKASCPSGVGAAVCYYFNGYGDWPQGNAGDTTVATDGERPVDGTPICRRPKYLLGTPRVHDNCPTDYKKIEVEEDCGHTAHCLGDAKGDAFRIGEGPPLNESKHKDFVEDCLLDDTGAAGDGPKKVYFNEIPTGITRGADNSVLGTPICQVAEAVKWKADGTLESGADVRHYHNTNASAANDTAANITG